MAKYNWMGAGVNTFTQIHEVYHCDSEESAGKKVIDPDLKRVRVQPYIHIEYGLDMWQNLQASLFFNLKFLNKCGADSGAIFQTPHKWRAPGPRRQMHVHPSLRFPGLSHGDETSFIHDDR